MHVAQLRGIKFDLINMNPVGMCTADGKYSRTPEETENWELAKEAFHDVAMGFGFSRDFYYMDALNRNTLDKILRVLTEE